VSGSVVFVPLYGRLDLAERCLRSLDATTPDAVPFLVIDDCGPQRASESWLAGVVAPGRPATLLVNDQNLGFVQTANRALAAREGRDVLLVNSDVVVFPGWYDGMLAAATQGVASVTAMSNEGSIATIAQASLYSSPEQLAPIAEAARQSATQPVAIPVGVGHCILLTDAALTEVGAFDTAFSPGYGEEVDWSIRARRAGWAHTAAPAVVVWHDAGASFGTGRTALRRWHELKLAIRYPREFLALRRGGAFGSVR